MGLTYRKNLGRPLTSDEIDANFEFFTSSLGGATTGSNTFVGNQIITGSILISGSIVPAVGVGQTTSSFDLGSPTAAWKDIYVSEGSIKFIKSGSASITLSAKDGGISIDGGSTISADGVSGQFITSKSLDTNVTVKDGNNSLLMGPIEVETNKEIIVEEGSDLTIFGDIEIQNVATADTALFAITASYALNSNPIFPYSGSAVITGSLIVNNGTNNVVNTSQYTLSDSSGQTALDWNQGLINYGGITALSLPSKVAIDNSGNESIDWSLRTLTDNSSTVSINWTNRLLNNSEGTPVIDYNDSASLLLTAGGSTLNVAKHATYAANGAGSLTITSPSTIISGTIFLNSPSGIYGFTSASSFNTGSTPGIGSNTAVAFAQNGANFFIYVYIGGRWRSASLF